jgi:signal transduction histidine kinase
MDFQRKQYRSAVWIWAALILWEALVFIWHPLALLGFVVLGFAVDFVLRVQKLKWYLVPLWLFGASIPVVGLIAVQQVIWYWAGRIVGVAAQRAPAILAPDAARQKLAEQAAEAVRAAEERAAEEREGKR